MPSSNPRQPFIAGNWKMYKPLEEARRLAEDILSGLPASGDARPRVGIFPNAIALAAVSAAAAGREDVMVGAQNIYFEKEGAFTGEISAEMVLSTGARGVLLGHSERRHVFGETDEMIGRKVARALEAGLSAVVCIGEKIEEREGGETEKVVARQLSTAVERVSSADELARLIFAYEPVWAIGTGKTATPSEGQEVHRFLRDRIRGNYRSLGGDAAKADSTLILYGGSVKPDNAAKLLAEADIDGFLVGGASLEAESFLNICKAAV